MATLRDQGDRLEAERIYVEARRIEKRQPVNRTGRHKAESAVATDNWRAIAVIERPMRLRANGETAEQAAISR